MIRRTRSLWLAMRCRAAGHSGRHEKWEHEHVGSLKVSTLVRRECTACGRVEYQR